MLLDFHETVQLGSPTYRLLLEIFILSEFIDHETFEFIWVAHVCGGDDGLLGEIVARYGEGQTVDILNNLGDEN